MNPSDFWLIRTAKNRVLGPWPREVLREKIQAGELHLQDEICSANGYWIYLHESEEVSRQLGVLPKTQDAEESTETETETETATDTATETVSAPVAEKVLPRAPVRHESSPTLYAPHTPQVQISRVQSPSVLKGILFVLVLGLIVSLIFVVQLTRIH